MVDAKIEAAFGPAPAGIDLTEDTRPGNNAAVIILLCIATISVILRMTSRFITRAGIKGDEYTIIMALVSILPPCPGCSPLCTHLKPSQNFAVLMAVDIIQLFVLGTAGLTFAGECDYHIVL